MKGKIKLFVMALVMFTLLSGIHMIKVADETTLEIMNKRELWYDADGYFILVNERTHLVGVYDGTKPLRHFSCEFDRDIDNNTVITAADLEKYGIQISERERRFIDMVCPEDTPVLIYEEDIIK